MRPLGEATVVITGATSGLGRYLAGEVAAAGARLVVHGRDPAKVDQVASEVGAAESVVADLARLADVERLAEEITTRCERIDVLVNNAGVGFGAPGAGREVSADGIELRLAVNYLAGVVLTRRLIPLLGSRVVNVASIGQYPLDFDDPMMERGYTGVNAYRRSKLAQIMWTFDLAAELAETTGTTVNALHPATLMDTAMVREARTGTMSTVEEGAEATMRLIADPALDRVTGRFFNGTKEERAHEQAYDPTARQRLRELTERLVNGR
jgi:NAD(P)-dependent dehydrogenase (short-subunit alcohol dehydrogenase family)